MLCTALAPIALATAVPAAPADPQLPDLASVANEIARRTNAFRSSQGVSPVNADARLAAAAQEFAQYMAATDRYGHEADGRAPEARARAAGYEYCVVAENLGFLVTSTGLSTAELASHLMDGWVDSPGHRRNLLLAAITDIGIGIAQSERSRRFYAVQLFGRPRSASVTIRVTNRTSDAVHYEIDGEDFRLPVRATRTHQRCTEGNLRMVGPNQGEVKGPLRDGTQYVATRDPSGQVRFLVR